MSTDIKFNKLKMSKIIQSGGFPGIFLEKLLDRWWSCNSFG